MKSYWVAICIFITACASQATTKAEAEAEAAEQLLLSMPPCGLKCLQGAVLASPCSPTDIACACSNATITDQVEYCVATSCSIRDSLSTKNVSDTLCQAPVRDHTHLVSYIGVAGLIVAVIAYLLRIVSRGVGEGSFITNLGWDDAAMTATMFLVVPVSGLSVVLANLGLGRDMWTVSFTNITNILKIYYADEILYLTALPLIKIAMLLTYLRIFRDKIFRICVYVAIGLNAGYIIAFTLITAFQCDPVSFSWTRWDGEHEGACRNINAQIFAAAAINVALDILVIGLPMPQLWKMSMNTRKKLLVMLMFGVGFFVTIVSILRLQYLIQFGHSTNVTWDYTRIGYWSTIEMHASVLCACMPAIRKLLKAAFPKMMGATTPGMGNTSNISGFSGHKSANSAGDKMDVQTIVRPKRSDSQDFIPLQDYSQSEHGRKPYGVTSHVGTGGYGYAR